MTGFNGFRWFQVVSGWFQLVSAGFGWFQFVSCFSKYANETKKIELFNLHCSCEKWLSNQVRRI